MKGLHRKIAEETKTCKDLRKVAWQVDYNTSKQMREIEQKHWDKLNFFINLSSAMNKDKER